MERYIFVSSAAHDLKSEDFLSIAEESCTNNERDDLTGVLILGDGTFFQILEGPSEAMRATIDRIKADQRHKGLSELNRRTAKRRMFSAWSLGCYRCQAVPDRPEWNIVELEDMLAALPPSPAPEVEVFLRTFFGSVAGRNPI